MARAVLVQVGAMTSRGPRNVVVRIFRGGGLVGAVPKCPHCRQLMTPIAGGEWSCPTRSRIRVTLNEVELSEVVAQHNRE